MTHLPPEWHCIGKEKKREKTGKSLEEATGVEEEEEEEEQEQER